MNQYDWHSTDAIPAVGDFRFVIAGCLVVLTLIGMNRDRDE